MEDWSDDESGDCNKIITDLSNHKNQSRELGINSARSANYHEFREANYKIKESRWESEVRSWKSGVRIGRLEDWSCGVLE
jgi:hypothetical protein